MTGGGDGAMLQLAAIVAAPFLGSFAGLLADRLPQGRPVIADRSRCDGCGAPLLPRDLMPVISWLALRGQSRCCGVALRPFLPGVELAALGLALWAAAVTGGRAIADPMTVDLAAGVIAAASSLLGAALIALTLIDIRCLRLPDALTLPLVAAGIGLSAAGLTGPLVAHAAAAVLGYAIVAGLAHIWRRLRGIEAIGLGDAKLLAAAGAWVGPDGLASTMIWACGIGIAWFTVRAVTAGPVGWRGAAPLGPGLAAGLWLTWLHGPLLIGAAP